jgi:hypothetical protein
VGKYGQSGTSVQFAGNAKIRGSLFFMAPTKEDLENEIRELEATLATLQEERKETEAKLK